MQEPNWGKLVEHYVDDGYSAKDTRRPAFQRMMTDLRKGKIDLILVADLSRLSRSISDFCGILEVLKEHGASFLSLKEQFDTSTPAGKMMLYNMINLAQFEREQTAERVALGCHSRAMRGLLNGGHEVLGFDKVADKKNTYVVNEEEAETVRTIFNTFLECSSLNRTATKLKELNIYPKVRKNRKEAIAERGIWTHQSLANLIQNHSYIAMREVNRKNKNIEASSLKPHEKYQVVKASWPSIVDQKTFDSAQVLLEDNRLLERRRLKGAERRVFIASGVIRCKECGRPLIGQSAHGATNVHRYYVHSYSKGEVLTCSIRRIRAEDVEEAISKHISRILVAGKYLDGVADRIAAQGKVLQSSSKSTTVRLQKELTEIEREMESAFKFQMKAEQGTESAKFFFEKLENLGQKKSALEKSISEVVEPESNVISLVGVRKDLEDRVLATTKGWTKLSAIERKRAIRRLIQNLVVGPQGIDIYYYSNALTAERSSGGFSGETENLAQVLPFRTRGTRKQGSKLSSVNCLSARMVIAVRLKCHISYPPKTRSN